MPSYRLDASAACGQELGRTTLPPECCTSDAIRSEKPPPEGTNSAALAMKTRSSSGGWPNLWWTSRLGNQRRRLSVSACRYVQLLL